MELISASRSILDQMSEVIEQLSDKEFTRPAEVLNDSTIGQHFRHAIEFFECLERGYSTGIISYDDRDHDRTIESSRILAIDVINRVKKFIDSCSLDKELILRISYSAEGVETFEVESNVARELVYNIEHVVHHMALVKIGIKGFNPLFKLPDGFGVAVSTIKYHRSQA